MNKYLVTYICTLFTLIVFDYLWLNIIADPIYKKEIGNLLLENPNLITAPLFYIIYAFGLFYFAILPQFDSEGIFYTAIIGGLFGFIVYSAYDITNLTLISGWTFKISIIDVLWGTFVSGISVAVGKLISLQLV